MAGSSYSRVASPDPSSGYLGPVSRRRFQTRVYESLCLGRGRHCGWVRRGRVEALDGSLNYQLLIAVSDVVVLDIFQLFFWFFLSKLKVSDVRYCRWIPYLKFSP